MKGLVGWDDGLKAGSESKSVNNVLFGSDEDVGETGDWGNAERLEEGSVTRDSGGRFSDSCNVDVAGAVEAGDIQREGGIPAVERSPEYAKLDSGELGLNPPFEDESKWELADELGVRAIGTALAKTFRPFIRRRSSAPKVDWRAV